MSASDVCSQQGAIQTHVYRLRYGRQTDGRRHIPKHNVDTLHTIPCSSRNLQGDCVYWSESHDFDIWPFDSWNLSSFRKINVLRPTKWNSRGCPL